ncbi:Generic methyltransferase [Lysobacter sp. A03]|nr:Generic methyltransferase [Lysobacter sp. A03]
MFKHLSPGGLIEVGCGAGALLDEFSRLGFRAVGLETSPVALDIARELATQTGGSQRIVEAPERSWRGTQRMVCAFDVLEHIERDGAAVKQWMEWLQPGGCLMISVPAHRQRWNEGDEWAGHWRRYDRDDIVGLMKRCGLSITHLECYGFPLANLTEKLGQRIYRRLLAERKESLSRANASANSGIDRTDALRLFHFLNTALGRLALRTCLTLQAMTSRTDWGSGYLVVAVRP